MIHGEYTHTCTDCGADIANGIMNWAEHTFACPGGAPNSNIESHWYQVEQQKQHAAWERRWDKIYAVMTVEERQEHWIRAMSGILDGNVMLYSSHSMTRLRDYERKMIDKYETASVE